MNHKDLMHATALLERANPVELTGLVSHDDLSAARAEIERRIAGSERDAVADAIAAHARHGSSRAIRRQGSAIRLAALGLAAAAGVTILALSTGAEPATQSASAQTISKALRALDAPSGSILHIDFTGTSSYPGGHSWTWTQDSWDELDSPWRQLTIDERQPGTPAGTAATYNQLYDPTTNTVFAPPLPASPHAVHITAAKWAAMTPQQRNGVRAINNSLHHPWMSQYIDQLKSKLASGRARLDGRVKIVGQRTIKITFPGSSEVDYVSPTSYLPVEISEGTPRSSAGITTYVFHTFEYLPAAASAGVFNLEAAHPTASVDTSLSDYRAANGRLFPDG
jgi:hypothetical protein